MKRENSSYRDPDGYVTHVKGDVFRVVTNSQSPILIEEYHDFFNEAVQKDMLVPFERTAALEEHNKYQYLKLKKLPLISYPYEWGFAQTKEAALLTLDIGLMALNHGLSLKDATAFNIQQYKGGMIFIDHTSFERSDNKLPWRPYSQFCRHFMVPLLLMSRTGRHANKLFRLYLDGPDLTEACQALPLRDRFRPSILFHIYLHEFLIRRFQNSNEEEEKKGHRKGNQKAYLQHLKQVVEKISPPKYETEWGDYYNNTNYQTDAFSEKEKILTNIVSQKRYECIWDIGGNNGHFSRLVAPYAGIVLSMDIDFAAIDYNYQKNRAENIDNIYPLVADLTNPSPSLGFDNAERTRVSERSKPDAILALALIHHLAITYNLPFPIIAQNLSLSGADLIIEFVRRNDSQVRKVLRYKDYDYPGYSEENFANSFCKFFTLENKYDIPQTQRKLYHFKAKGK